MAKRRTTRPGGSAGAGRAGSAGRRPAARRPQDVPAEIVRELNAGVRATSNLAEGLAVDFAALLAVVAPELGGPAAAAIDPADGVTGRMRTAAELLLDARGVGVIDELAGHPSDTARGWAAYVVGLASGLSLPERYGSIRRFADDPHFAVREWAWLGVREHIAAEPELAIELGRGWTAERSANLRRFAVEATRPRGVWCAHIGLLKQKPQLGEPLLEPLRADPERYVQDSVANWLNDAAKTEPGWVTALCAGWKREAGRAAGGVGAGGRGSRGGAAGGSSGRAEGAGGADRPGAADHEKAARATAYICRRAVRSLGGG